MITIRDAELQDASRILEIYDYYVQKTAITFEYDTPSLAEFQERMRNTMKRYPYLVIEEDGTIQGYAYAGPLKARQAYDWSCEMTIYLDHNARRCGMGKKLYSAMEQALKKMGIRNLYACIGYPEEEDEYLTRNSAQFHAHLSYERIGTFHHCGSKFGRWYDMIWMEKIIGDPDRAEEKPAPLIPYPELKRETEEKKGQNIMSKEEKLITGIHHAALRCCGEEEMNKAVAFYTDVLGLSVKRRWGSGKESGCMIDAGNGLIEFFADAEPGRKIGPVDHFALATDQVDACVEAVRKAGFPVTVEPKDVVIASKPPFPVRIAFVEGAAGESIELFCEK